MRLSFFSNYLNAHTLPVCLAFSEREGVDFTFVACDGLGQSVGRRNLNEEYEFVLRSYEDAEAAACARAHATEDDVVIFGHMGGDESLVKARMRAGKLSFRYAERILKRGMAWRFFPPKAWRTYDWFLRYRAQPFYVLCAGAYAAYDLKQSGFPAEKCLTWGYFPGYTTEPSAGALGSRERENSTPALLWAGRMIDLKHPEAALKLAKRLLDDGRAFRLTMAGDGPLMASLKSRAVADGLQSCVSFSGEVDAADMPSLMRSSDIFLFTSGRKEGWGAVLSEAMTQGCAVVANVEAGASASLVRHEENGLLYNGSADGLHSAVSRLLDEPSFASRLGAKAVDTMSGDWSVGRAVGNFLLVAQAIIKGEANPIESGPCSPAKLLREGWYMPI